MIKDIVKNTLISLALGYLVNLLCKTLEISFLQMFLNDNLIVILVALLVINTATMSIVLSKILEVLQSYQGVVDSAPFAKTKRQMLLAVQEQIVLIIFAVLALSMLSSPYVITL